MDGFLRHGGRLQKVMGGRIPSCEYRAPAAECGAGHSYARTVHGLGFPLHPFVRGVMFYYGLDFHDLAPNFILNILAFIVVCEAFLRIRPHIGLWLKTFNVKLKVVVGQQGSAEVPWWTRCLISPGLKAPMWRP